MGETQSWAARSTEPYYRSRCSASERCPKSVSTCPSGLSDGRLQQSARTRKAVIEAYLDLLREKQQPPTTPEIAKRAKRPSRRWSAPTGTQQWQRDWAR